MRANIFVLALLVVASACATVPEFLPLVPAPPLPEAVLDSVIGVNIRVSNYEGGAMRVYTPLKDRACVIYAGKKMVDLAVRNGEVEEQVSIIRTPRASWEETGVARYNVGIVPTEEAREAARAAARALIREKCRELVESLPDREVRELILRAVFEKT